MYITGYQIGDYPTEFALIWLICMQILGRISFHCKFLRNELQLSLCGAASVAPEWLSDWESTADILPPAGLFGVFTFKSSSLDAAWLTAGSLGATNKA